MWTAIIDSKNRCVIVSNNQGDRSTVLSIQACYADRLDRCKAAWIDIEAFLNDDVPLPDGYLLENRLGEPVVIGPNTVMVHRDGWNSSAQLTISQHQAVIFRAFEACPSAKS
jgi:hypothetical protein